jgi:hypothetical protein
MSDPAAGINNANDAHRGVARADGVHRERFRHAGLPGADHSTDRTGHGMFVSVENVSSF